MNAQHDLVLPLARLGAPQPDLVLAVARRDVRDHLAHRDALAGAVVALQLRLDGRLEDEPQLLAQLLTKLYRIN